MNAINVKGNERWARAGTFSAKESKESDDDVPLGGRPRSNPPRGGEGMRRRRYIINNNTINHYNSTLELSMSLTP